VGTIPTLSSLAKEVGGARVEVESLARANQDPHFVEARPNFMLVLNRADVLLQVGLDLEIGWLPPLVRGSHNPKIQDGRPGSLDCSQVISVLDIAMTTADRSMGDIHPAGNPHYWLAPDNAKLIAREIATRFGQIDPQGQAEYAKNLATFDVKVDAKLKEWIPLIAAIRGARIATYHKSWTYTSQWLGMEEVGYVEPNPGIPPDPSHLVHLIEVMRGERASMLLLEDFDDENIAELVALKAGARVVVLPSDVGATTAIKDWFSLVDEVLHRLASR
jgi:zinc/manganese transport system substrate-binding protein